MKCRLCRRETERESALCVYHGKAREALRAGYERWSDAYGELSWRKYGNRIKGRPETGQWVKDVTDGGTDE